MKSETKKCNKCGVEKDINEFCRDKTRKNGFRNECKVCQRQVHKIYRLTHKESLKKKRMQYCLKNREEVREQNRRCYLKYKEKRSKEGKQYYLKNKEIINKRYNNYYLKNKNKINKHKKQYRLENKERLREKSKQYCLENKDKRKEYRTKNRTILTERHKKYVSKNRDRINFNGRLRLKNNIDKRILNVLRARMSRALKGTLKASGTQILIGCSIPEFKNYIESQFLKNMSWDNYGQGIGKWNLDHIIPCAIFKFADPSEQKQCFHFSNLRPLWERGDGGNLQKHSSTEGLKLLYNDSTTFI